MAIGRASSQVIWNVSVRDLMLSKMDLWARSQSPRDLLEYGVLTFCFMPKRDAILIMFTLLFMLVAPSLINTFGGWMTAKILQRLVTISSLRSCRSGKVTQNLEKVSISVQKKECWRTFGSPETVSNWRISPARLGRG